MVRNVSEGHLVLALRPGSSLMSVGLLAERDVIRAVQDRTDDKYLTTRPESAQLMGGSDPPIREPLIKEWLDKTIAGPYNGDLASFVQKISHVGDREVTFPGAQVPLPPQLVLALVAWLQGQILAVMRQVCDVATVSAASAARGTS